MKANNKPLYMQIYHEIKDNILQGVLTKDTKLDSVRSYSIKRNISTTTVEKAYNQLVVEGYVESKARSGFIVQDIKNLHIHSKQNFTSPIHYKPKKNNQLTQDLFDLKTYKSIMNKVINYQGDSLYTECHPQGEIELRKEIQKYVKQERNVNCDVHQIIIGPGIQNLLQMLLHLESRKTVSYLKPEFAKAMTMFRYNKYSTYGVDTIDDLCKTHADYIYLSPSNIYPSGDVVKVSDRNKLLAFAKKNKTYIIEDDYNFFIRYNSYLIPSIFSLDNNQNVIYVGSFSKTIIPSIRISYMILPIPLYEKYKNSYQYFSQGVSKLDQLALALYIKEGLFKRHTKKLYGQYKEKNEKILEALQDKEVIVSGSDSNLHVIIQFHNLKSIQCFEDNCNKHDYQYTKLDDQTILFPYSGIELDHISQVIQTLFQ